MLIPQRRRKRARPTTRSPAPKRGEQPASVGGTSGSGTVSVADRELAAYRARIEVKRVEGVQERLQPAAVAMPIAAPPSSLPASASTRSGRRAKTKLAPPWGGTIALEIASYFPSAESYSTPYTWSADDKDTQLLFCYTWTASPRYSLSSCTCGSRLWECS